MSERIQFWRSATWVTFGFFLHAAIGNAVAVRPFHFCVNAMVLFCLALLQAAIGKEKRDAE